MAASTNRFISFLLRAAQVLAALSVGAGLTLGFFLLLPLLQKMGRPPESTVELRSVDAAVLQPPPPPPPEEEEPEEEEVDEPPPMELAEESTPPMDLSQLEMALDPGFGAGAGGAGALAGGRLGGRSDAEREKETDAVFSMADLDQAPKIVSQPPPRYPSEMRARKTRGTVYVLFIVDHNGRVVKPKVQKSTHSAFARPALEAVRRWRFEPGKRNGKAVQFRMRVPITFAVG